MFQTSGTPFDSIESAHEFMTLLAQTVYEVRLDIEADVEKEETSNVPRRLDALRMALYTLEKLDLQLNRSRRALNDLRTLRRLLFEERTVVIAEPRTRTETKASAPNNASPVTTSVQPVERRSDADLAY